MRDYIGAFLASAGDIQHRTTEGGGPRGTFDESKVKRDAGGQFSKKAELPFKTLDEAIADLKAKQIRFLNEQFGLAGTDLEDPDFNINTTIERLGSVQGPRFQEAWEDMTMQSRLLTRMYRDRDVTHDDLGGPAESVACDGESVAVKPSSPRTPSSGKPRANR